MTTTYTNPADRAHAINPHVQISRGINWTWATGFTQDQANQFVRWLVEHGVDHRGVYPPWREIPTYSVRYR